MTQLALGKYFLCGTHEGLSTHPTSTFECQELVHPMASIGKHHQATLGQSLVVV